MKKGFTLVELLVATAVSAVILAGAAVAFASSLRLLRIAMAESELSLASRHLRDRLLFAVERPTDATRVSGLLSGVGNPSVVEGGATPNVVMTCPHVTANFTAVGASDVRLCLEDGRLVNERATDRDRSRAWLLPVGFRLAEATIGDIVTVQDGDTTDARRLTLDLTVTSTPHPHAPTVSRALRVHVPVFGKEQPK